MKMTLQMKEPPDGGLRKAKSPRARLGLAIALALSGCAVGPTFKSPAPPAAAGYTPQSLPAQTESTPVAGGEAQHFRAGDDLPGQWWTAFGSTQLDELIQAAMTNYPDIAAQQAALREARENVRSQQGVYFPQVQTTANADREKISGASIAPGFPGFITNLFEANVGVSYVFDVFGGERRAVEGLQAQALSQNFQLEASYLTLTANVASTAVQLASVREQIVVTREIIALQERQLEVIQRQFRSGTRTQADVLQQQSNLAQVRVTLPALAQQQAAAEHLLAVLTGRFPADAMPPAVNLSDLKLPPDLPVSLPSALVAQRPDIQLQQALLHEACAGIGVATANMLPQLTLSGSTGGETLTFSTLLKPDSAVWNVAAGFTQPIFEGGTLLARRRAAVAAYDQASAQYRLVVLNAFQNVADTLTALDNDAHALKAENDAVSAAQAGLDLIQRQYNAGAVSYVSLLTAQQAYQQTRIAFVRAVASRYIDTISLFQALGGGWWNRNDAGTLPRRASTG
jgi:NodT family efflux transporter outer membrane factor (OMF) lipoprotein